MNQRISIKFCVQDGIKCRNVLIMFCVTFGESAISKARVYEWYMCFQVGCENVENDERQGGPITSTTDKVADDINTSDAICHVIFSDVFVHKTCGNKIRSKIIKFLTTTASCKSCSGVIKWGKPKFITAKTYFMLFNFNEVVYRELLPRGQKINKNTI